MTTINQSRFKKSYYSLYAVALICIPVGGFLWVQHTVRDFTLTCDQVVGVKSREIRERRLDDAAAKEARLLKERLDELIRVDDREAVEREKWVQVIHRSTQSTLDKLNRRQHNLVAQTAFMRKKTSASVPGRAGKQAGFWSFERLAVVHPPELENAEWCRNPIDQFVLRKLRDAGLQPNPAASTQTLTRRLAFDLTGLPPGQVDAWTNDNGYDQYVRKLMSAPTFGERWARVWLDLARYADSNGYEEDELRPLAYPYRDFVIWAMNIDLPFDSFAKWQIAGDELEPNNPMAVAATGFMTAAPYNTFFPQESERMDELDSMVSTYGSAMLGMTVGCARCHDHLYDPIPTKEYYHLISIFAETKRSHSYLVEDGGAAYREYFDPVDERQQEIKKMRFARVKEDKIAEIDYFTEEEKDILRQPLDPNNLEQDRLASLCERCLLVTDDHIDDDTEPLPQDKARFDRLMAEIKDLSQHLPPCPPKGLTLTGSSISETHVLEDGDLKNKEELVGPGFLSAITVGVEDWDDEQWKHWVEDSEQPAPRSALANWTADVEQGAGSLLARVIVNRIWQQYFGNGLVRTPGDFGMEGESPSHPELLEWLAMELVQNEWSLKHIHRLIVNSSTYRQNSQITAEKMKRDPENKLLSRFVPRRISAEMMRDSMLSISGSLNPTMFGPGVKPPIPRDAVYNTQDEVEDTWPVDYNMDRNALWRRGIYVTLKRTVPVPMLRIFDAPDGSFACQQRKTATLPTQALALWNSHFVLTQSRRLAERAYAAENDVESQISALFQWTYFRQPTPAEMQALVDFMQENSARIDAAKHKEQLTDLCQVLFMSNEFFYLN